MILMIDPFCYTRGRWQFRRVHHGRQLHLHLAVEQHHREPIAGQLWMLIALALMWLTRGRWSYPRYRHEAEALDIGDATTPKVAPA
ncbi:hypothetical protein [Candidatus Mycolicibacterium alkanivorans]|uniref:Uncharacterized protein n=1 Tax=Candidatus Mycolicibacterium alkanivorans TaxID=2954114 RepID=A0ABS9YZR0_9MYCO|nr:hypothetical protein [Candidatus Mycolicibacterium alkanivorans]MCI4676695.1 hypothetical protein [Candidatus Mycolicibacterium alkanivorans]